MRNFASCQLAAVTLETIQRQNPDGIERRPAWITSAEWEEAEVLTDRNRRWQWLAGRWTAKSAVARLLGQEGTPFCIRSRNHNSRPCRPALTTTQGPNVSLSIAHTARLAVAVASGTGPVGVDVVAADADVCHLPVPDVRHWAACEAAYKTGVMDGEWVVEDWNLHFTSPSHFQARYRPTASSRPLAGRVWQEDGHVFAVCRMGGEHD